MGFFKYIVREWDETEKKENIAKGLVYAENFSEAASKLEKFYDLIAIIGLYGLEEGEVYDFDLNSYDTNLFKVTAEEA